jgi:chromosome segregation ATPase
MLDALDDQIHGLEKTQEEAQGELREAEAELERMEKHEKETKEKLESEEKEYVQLQSTMLVLESDLREMGAEYERQKKVAITESARTLELEKAVRRGKLKATEKYVSGHRKAIHRVDRVCSTLSRMKLKLDSMRGDSTQKVRVGRAAENTARRPGV